MKKIKIGVVPYMNAKPLIYGLGNNELVELRFTVPSLLSELLKRGEVDVALVPCTEYLLDTNLLIIPDIAIASRGEVKSVKLLVRSRHLSLRGAKRRSNLKDEIPRYTRNDNSAFHPEDIKKVALDIASNTSKVLLRIIMNEKYHLDPAFTSWDPSEENLDAQADAFLIIGDNALKTNGTSYLTLDLGKEWQEMTQLPFVYAFWATKRETKIPGIKDILQEAKVKGLGKLEELSAVEAKRLGLTVEECFDYLSKNICYDLGEEELAGLRIFYKYAVKMGLVKEGINVEFYNA